MIKNLVPDEPTPEDAQRLMLNFICDVAPDRVICCLRCAHYTRGATELGWCSCHAMKVAAHDDCGYWVISLRGLEIWQANFEPAVVDVR